jgi:hypothetical protein
MEDLCYLVSIHFTPDMDGVGNKTPVHYCTTYCSTVPDLYYV